MPASAPGTIGTPSLIVEDAIQNKMWLEELVKPSVLQMDILREKWRLGTGATAVESAAGNSWKSEAGKAQR